MKNSTPGTDVARAPDCDISHKTRWPRAIHCSICNSIIWLHPIVIREPQRVPEPRRSWVLCQSCHQALLVEMRRSPVRSPLRLRIALGIVAAERSPHAYNTNTHLRDQRSFIGIGWVFFIAMLIHLTIIIILVTITR